MDDHAHALVVHEAADCSVRRLITSDAAFSVLPDRAATRVDAQVMHGTHHVRRPIDTLRRRGGVVGQRLLAAAWPGLAELTLEPARVARQAPTGTIRATARRSTTFQDRRGR